MEYVVVKNQEVMDVDVLKLKTSYDFIEFLCEVRKGYRPNYEFILEEISFIDLMQTDCLDYDFSLTTLQYYLNNKWKK